MKMTRRNVLTALGLSVAARAVPVAAPVAQRRVLTLVYDKSLGMMRAIDRLVP